MRAATGGHGDVVEVLLEARADLKARDNKGSTALMRAARAGRIKVIEVLLKAGADVNVRDNSGETALTIAIKKEDRDIERLLRNFEAKE